MIVGRVAKWILQRAGYEIHRVPRPAPVGPAVVPKFDKIHYGCGYVYLSGWLNTDIIATGPANYRCINLVAKHPFPDDVFRYAFSEDFIEHIDQASSLMFFIEAHRTLKRGGVLRITTPALENVLQKHYDRLDFGGFETARRDAFSSLGHVHFYSRGSLEVVAEHIGFDIEFVESGVSVHTELNGLNTRFDPVYLHAELTKR